MKVVRSKSDMNYLFEEFDLVSCDISELSIKENLEKIDMLCCVKES